MSIMLDDTEIQKLVAEPKVLPSNYLELLKLKPKTGHFEQDLAIIGENGSRFRLILRQAIIDKFNFSFILAYQLPNSNVLFRLRRFNGKHIHTNKIERVTFYDYHMHCATERYQEIGMHEEGFAVPIKAYVDLNGAINYAISECGFELPSNTQLPLV
jgi:hypothetical protein